MTIDGWPDISGRIEGGHHILPVRVYYEDTDFSGLVYHASFLRFCERGRSDFLRLAGLNHGDLLGGGGGESVFFAVRRMSIEFLGPGRIDDLLQVATAFKSVTGARLVIDQRVRRGDHILMTAEVTVVLLGRDGRPRRITRALKATLDPYVLSAN